MNRIVRKNLPVPTILMSVKNRKAKLKSVIRAIIKDNVVPIEQKLVDLRNEMNDAYKPSADGKKKRPTRIIKKEFETLVEERNKKVQDIQEVQKLISSLPPPWSSSLRLIRNRLLAWSRSHTRRLLGLSSSLQSMPSFSAPVSGPLNISLPPSASTEEKMQKLREWGEKTGNQEMVSAIEGIIPKS